jgi:cytidine deaminase
MANVGMTCSIREFCELQMPIFMFDKDGAFVVMKLEQACILLFKDGYTLISSQLLPLSFGPEALPPPGSLPARG